MKLLMRKLQTEWPVWLAISFFALLPFGRAIEAPLLLFVLALPFQFRNAEQRARIKRAAVVLVPLFLCYWLPMVISSFDSYLPEVSSFKSFAALRYLAAAISIAALLHRASARWQVLRWSSFLLVFWAVDGFVQLVFGADLFGFSMHPDRLNALFIRDYQFYGPTLAMLSPLLLEYARRQWPAWAWVVSFGLILGAVLIAGMRAGWLLMGVAMGIYLLMMFSHENRELRFATMTIPILSLGIITMGYFASPLLQSRIDQSLTMLDGTRSAVDFASSERLPIFQNALRMYRAHPVNGVGVRSFEKAYLEFAEAGDVHVAKNLGRRGEVHAHNLILEIMADTGTIGLLCLLAGALIMWRYWRAMDPGQRLESFPFLLALLLIHFPVNSHFAIYGTYLSSMIWVLAGMWAAAFRK